jgi:hypothetical protein
MTKFGFLLAVTTISSGGTNGGVALQNSPPETLFYGPIDRRIAIPDKQNGKNFPKARNPRKIASTEGVKRLFSQPFGLCFRRQVLIVGLDKCVFFVLRCELSAGKNDITRGVRAIRKSLPDLCFGLVWKV